MLSELRFASLLAYSPHGTTEVSRRSQRVRDKIKSGESNTLAIAVQRLRETFPTAAIDDFLGSDVILVPAPRSAPLRQASASWPARSICQVLAAAGLGAGMRPFLERTEVVPKSAFAAPGMRPSVERHFETMRAVRDIDAPARITVVDDVITKGATILAAASRLAEAFPDSRVRAFALLRTCGLVPEIEKILEPVHDGLITYASGRIDRTP